MNDASQVRTRETAARPGVNPWLVALVVSMATFMEVLDTSIANVALPHIAGGLSATTDEATWVLTSYLVSNAIILPASGWLATVFGRKRFYMTCVALFSVSSLLCGFAPSLGMLVFFRVLQGLGGGGLAPSEQSILADTFPPQKRGMAFALYGIAVVVAPAVGPTLGGWITDNYSWRWLFFINIPVGAVSLFLTHRLVQDPPHVTQERKRRLHERGYRADFWGFGLIAIGLGCLQIVLDKGQREDWFASTFIIILSIIAGGALLFGCISEMVSDEPVVELSLLKRRTILMANIIMFMIGVVLFGSTVLIPLFLQELMGYTATRAGLVITPGGFVVMGLMPLVGFLVSRVQARYLVAFGLLLSGIALYHMTSFSLDIDYSTAMWARIYQASALAFLFVPINTAAYSEVPPEKSNNFSALLNLSRNLGGSFGISIAQALLNARAQFHQSVLVSRLTPYNHGFAARISGIARSLSHRMEIGPVHAVQQAYGVIYSQVQRQAGMLSYLDVFWALSILCFCLVPLVFIMKANKPGGGPAMAH
ncbi:MAG TPA: DHA2 family efflux MFS transporter permease subunit [Bryobacteraceae bacterium]|nr:DHA2 family efflux MFS transporter permease subunit [Bryobacteraceae bacterium]